MFQHFYTVHICALISPISSNIHIHIHVVPQVSPSCLLHGIFEQTTSARGSSGGAAMIRNGCETLTTDGQEKGPIFFRSPCRSQMTRAFWNWWWRKKKPLVAGSVASRVVLEVLILTVSDLNHISEYLMAKHQFCQYQGRVPVLEQTSLVVGVP